MRSKAVRIAIKIAVMLAVMIAAFVCWAMLEFVKPTNVADNADSAKQAKMLSIALHVADLAPIPTDATITSIKTEGNTFTRSFTVGYAAKPAVIGKWLSASKGIKHAKVSKTEQAAKYIIEAPKDHFGYAEVVIDHARNTVRIYVSKS